MPDSWSQQGKSLNPKAGQRGCQRSNSVPEIAHAFGDPTDPCSLSRSLKNLASMQQPLPKQVLQMLEIKMQQLGNWRRESV